MDNLGFQPDLESGYHHRHQQTSGNVSPPPLPHSNSSNPYVIFSDNNIFKREKSSGGRTKKHHHSISFLSSKPSSSTNLRSPKLSSSSFNVPKRSNVCKYKRFSSSLSLKRSRVLKDMLDETEKNNSRSNSEPIYCSISEVKPKNDPVGDIFNINPLNNYRVHEHSLSNNKYINSSSMNSPTSVPSSPVTEIVYPQLNRSQSTREQPRYTASPSLLKQNRKINKLDNIDSIKMYSTSKQNNLNTEAISPSLSFTKKKMNHFAIEDESAMNQSLAYLSKCTNNCMDPIAAKNNRNLQQEYLRPTDSIATVSGNVPMFHPEMYQQASPRPCSDNKRNLRRSSKMLDRSDSSGQSARLKRRGILRGWKLQFIPSDHTQRRNFLLCCMLALACALILLATGLVVYVTTVMGSLTAKLGNSWHAADTGVVAGEFRIVNEHYEPALQNTSSSDFKQLAQQITQLLDLLFARSTIAGNYNHSHVTHLLPPSPSGIDGVLVKCQVVLASAPPHGKAASLVGLEFLRGLERRQGQMWLGDFVIDVQSIGFVALLDDSVPVVNTTPSSSLQPGWSEWSPWSDCNATATSGGFTQSRTRLCRLDQGRGTPLSSIEPCLLLEAGGGDLEVRDCDHTGHSNDTVDIVMSATMFENTNRPRYSINTEKKYSDDVSSRVTLIKNSSDTENILWLGDNETEFHTVDVPETTSKIPVMEDVTDLSVSLRHCDECLEEEVCVALSHEQVPICRQPLDPTDPTGCGGHCLINTELCQKLDVDAFRCVDDSYCLSTEWRCANQLCIPEVKRCDGHMNCYDRTDEHDCDCDLDTHFHCGNNTSCLPNKKRCDGIIDCWDGTDELNCTLACPSSSQFTCTNGQCIPRAQFCDGYDDCSDSSDEPFGCGGECKNHEWKCNNGRCIKKQMVCDGTDSCGDKSDEENCPLKRQERHFEESAFLERLYVR